MPGGRLQPAWWQELSAGYAHDLSRRGRRPNTVLTYLVELRDFGDFLHEEGVPGLGALTREHIEEWQDEFRQRQSPRSQQVAAAALRGALRFATQREMGLPPNLWLSVAQPRAPLAKPRPIAQRDLQVLTNYLETPRERPASLGELRTRALFWLIFTSGARISEALSLRRDSVVDRTATLIQKGGSEHQIVISAKAAVALQQYLAARADDRSEMFVTATGRLDRKEAQHCWDELARKVGVPRFRSHQLRHSCGTEMHRSGASAITVAKHLGHRGLGMVMGYVDIALEARREAVAALDNLIA